MCRKVAHSLRLQRSAAVFVGWGPQGVEKVLEAPLLALGEALRRKHEEDAHNPLVRRPFFVTVAYPADDANSALALDAFLGTCPTHELKGVGRAGQPAVGSHHSPTERGALGAAWAAAVSCRSLQGWRIRRTAASQLATDGVTLSARGVRRRCTVVANTVRQSVSVRVCSHRRAQRHPHASALRPVSLWFGGAA